MGLDFSNNDAHWSYGGFHRFRSRLGNEIGIALDRMQGFGGDVSWDSVHDAIKDLLNHSDCEDQLSPHQMDRHGVRCPRCGSCSVVLCLVRYYCIACKHYFYPQGRSER
jgi:hypothetical protein